MVANPSIRIHVLASSSSSPLPGLCPSEVITDISNVSCDVPLLVAAVSTVTDRVGVGSESMFCKSPLSICDLLCAMRTMIIVG